MPSNTEYITINVVPLPLQWRATAIRIDSILGAISGLRHIRHHDGGLVQRKLQYTLYGNSEAAASGKEAVLGEVEGARKAFRASVNKIASSAKSLFGGGA